MSTSVVQMMDISTAGAATTAHQRRTTTSAANSLDSTNGSSTTNLHHHHHLIHNHHYQNLYNNNNNGPINFAMKFFNNNNNNNIVVNANRKNIATSITSSTASSTTSSSSSSSPAALTTPTSSPQVKIKLEPRVPSPCTADLVCMAVNGSTAATTAGSNTSTGTGAKSTNIARLPHLNGGGDTASVSGRSPSNIKDLSLYLSTKGQQQQQLLITTANGGIANISTTTNQHNKQESQDNHNNHSSLSSGHQHLTPSTLTTKPPVMLTIPNGDDQPPPLLMNKNHHYRQNSQSPPSMLTSLSSSPTSLPSPSSTTNGHFSIIGAGLKRQHDEAFGHHHQHYHQAHGQHSDSITPSSPPPSMTTMITMNGHNTLHQMPTTPNNNSMVASPTSSSYSDFGSACKEEMSPSNSVNGYTNVDSLGGDPKKKKGPVPRQQEELCLVCGDRASGYHYNALTCEGCKGFFRRSITKNAVYQCKYGNNCEIDMYMRRKCQECRLKKCLSVGMRPECVVPEYQCAMKREAKRAIKDKDKPNSTTKEGLSPNNTQIMIIEEKQPLTPIMTNNWNGSQNGDVEIALKLSLEQDGIIKKLVFYQDEFESPSGEDIEKIAPFPYGENEEDNKRRFQHITEMTILTVQLIVEFSKRVPYFDKLFREDQITLLKACSSEVMMLRCSRKYDIKTDSIVYANNQPYTRQNYSSACISYVADTLFNFCRRMHMLKVDNAEYALLTAIVIFSDRPQLLEAHKVEEIQEKYIEILRIYVETRRPPNKCHFAKLLGILTELRTLGNINSEMCVSLKVQNKKLPAFLAEIWDIQDS
ncbi:ecdysone receptor-like isoform X1 [Dermatophagoides pteronyssinus]|uniref:ecdysone receptor-like isoform X1 n=1 Tax=Dermatophagoides pteronyssinus TaxID=6956 RepID=UPI003F67D09B